jgi:hypothetical protein
LLRGHSAPEATVFGYVLAHEIGHVLQGTARHSDVGVMRARWASSDFVEMGKVLLTFTKEDEEQIRVRLSANACGSGPSKSDRRVDRASLPLAPSAIK